MYSRYKIYGTNLDISVHVKNVQDVIAQMTKGIARTQCSQSMFFSDSRLWLCTFTLTVSLGAVLLLPTTIFSNEILLMYPKSYYVKWLNGSLIHGMCNKH